MLKFYLIQIFLQKESYAYTKTCLQNRCYIVFNKKEIFTIDTIGLLF